jgi:hypothetical protein
MRKTFNFASSIIMKSPTGSMQNHKKVVNIKMIYIVEKSGCEVRLKRGSF